VDSGFGSWGIAHTVACTFGMWVLRTQSTIYCTEKRTDEFTELNRDATLRAEPHEPSAQTFTDMACRCVDSVCFVQCVCFVSCVCFVQCVFCLVCVLCSVYVATCCSVLQCVVVCCNVVAVCCSVLQRCCSMF